MHLAANQASGLVAGASLWPVLCFFRYKKGDPSTLSDVVIHLIALIWALRDCLWQRYAPIGVGFALIDIAIILILRLVSSKPRSDKRNEVALDGNVTSSRAISSSLSPLIFQCRTTHTRMFPERHSFSYSYLFVGIPIGWQECIGSVISADVTSSRCWFQVNAADYLTRDNSLRTLEQKLASYLRTEREDPSDYPYAYLVTAPRVLQYSFNPVSFWYLYSKDRELQAVILEVNNTFDERRPYLLKKFNDGSSSGANGERAPLSKSEPVKIRRTWQKDFHVSPFNSRDGDYSAVVEDPQPFSYQRRSRVSNTITLLEAGRAKVVARVSSIRPAMNPVNLKPSELYILVVMWSWVGFLTFPRILFQAWKLFFRKQLQLWLRPEVKKGSMGRKPFVCEVMLEQFFRSYLTSLVNNAAANLSLSYVPAPGMGPRLEMNTTRLSDKDQLHLELMVLTPAFYSQFVHYRHTSEAFDREFLLTDHRNRTLWLSNPKVLAFLTHPKSGPSDSAGLVSEGFDHLRWQLLSKLRCPPQAMSYRNPSKEDEDFSREDIRSRGASELDVYVRQNCPDSALYRRTVQQLFLAERFAIGLPSVIKAVDITIRILLAVICWYVSTTNEREDSLGLAVQMLYDLMTFNAMHIWAIGKGIY